MLPVRYVHAGVANRTVLGVLRSLYVSIGLILARMVYHGAGRFAMATMASSIGDLMALSPVVRYKWFFRVFKAVPILVNTALWSANHPLGYLPKSFKRNLA